LLSGDKPFALFTPSSPENLKATARMPFSETLMSNPAEGRETFYFQRKEEF
jgi:hypothetical protein